MQKQASRYVNGLGALLATALGAALPGLAADPAPAMPGSAPELRNCTELPQAPGERPRISHHHSDWRPPCRLDLPCPGSEGEGWEESCPHDIPEDCGSITGLACGEMPDQVSFGLCLGAQALCERTRALQAGPATARHDYVSDYDFQRAALRDLPFDFACSGLGPSELFDWCHYAEVLFPHASLLEALLWRGGWAFEPIGTRRIVGCRMDGGSYGALELRVTESAIECLAGDSDVGRHGPRLGADVALADVDGDGYLDAVMPFFSGGVVRSVKLTRRDASSRFWHVGSRTPSFDCQAAGTPTERRICSVGALASLDAELAALYELLVSRVDDGSRQRIRGAQRAFLRDRDAACGVSDEAADCLADRYQERIAALRREAWQRRCDLFGADPCDRSLPLPPR